MRYSIVFILISLYVSVAIAEPQCVNYPESERANPDVLKQVLNEEGFTIKEFKINKHCYEVYGLNKQGKKIELYFDMKTLAIISGFNESSINQK